MPVEVLGRHSWIHAASGLVRRCANCFVDVADCTGEEELRNKDVLTAGPRRLLSNHRSVESLQIEPPCRRF